MITEEYLINKHAFSMHNNMGENHCQDFSPILIFPLNCRCLDIAQTQVKHILAYKNLQEK